MRVRWGGDGDRVDVGVPSASADERRACGMPSLPALYVVGSTSRPTSVTTSNPAARSPADLHPAPEPATHHCDTRHRGPPLCDRTVRADPQAVSRPVVGVFSGDDGGGRRHVRVRVGQLLVTVHVGVRFVRRSVGVRVLMVVVVHVPVVVDDDLVAMPVVVALPEQEGDAGRHQRTGNQFAHADGLGQHQRRAQRAHRRTGPPRARPRPPPAPLPRMRSVWPRSRRMLIP